MKRALLCVCPPYPMIGPPAGAAALLGYLKAHGISDFGFVDLRLGTPSCYEATYSPTGVFGESFVIRYLRELESRQIAFPSFERPPALQTRFFRQFPNEDVVVALSRFVVIRSMDRRDKQEILAVNYVNGRFLRRPARERPLLDELARQPMSVPVSMKPLRRTLEKLHRFGIVTLQ